MIQRFSLPHILEQMEIAQRKGHHLIESVRCLLCESKLPRTYWIEALLIAIFTINRFPSLNISNKSPFEILFIRKLDYNYLRVFGTLCFSLLPKIRGVNSLQQQPNAVF